MVFSLRISLLYCTIVNEGKPRSHSLRLSESIVSFANSVVLKIYIDVGIISHFWVFPGRELCVQFLFEIRLCLCKKNMFSLRFDSTFQRLYSFISGCVECVRATADLPLNRHNRSAIKVDSLPKEKVSHARKSGKIPEARSFALLGISTYL